MEGVTGMVQTAPDSSGVRTPHISVEALATDVSIFANKAAAWVVQTGRADQPSHSMRLH